MKIIKLVITVMYAIGSLWVAAELQANAPIENVGMKVRLDVSGVQSIDYRFTNNANLKSWNASWIWINQTPSPRTVMFRKKVILDEKIQNVKVWVTADTKFLLYINGKLVARGPADIGRDYTGGSTERWFYDQRDLTPYFKKGINVISAVVFQQWPITFTVSRGQPGFLFEAEIVDIKGNKKTIGSDKSWRAFPGRQFLSDKSCDLTREPVGWMEPYFDDKNWISADLIKDVWEPLIPSEIPPLMEVQYPVRYIEGLPYNGVYDKNGHFKVVFDRVLSAYPIVSVEGGAGATLKIQAHHSYSFKLRGGHEILELPFMDEIAPAYTVELSNVIEPLKIEKAGAIFTSQPVEYIGDFKCSDERLNQIWDVSRWAVQINLQSHHLDSPNHQEPISDPGDYLIESMVNYYAFALPWLTRQDVRKFAWILKNENYHNFHTSYSLGWVQMLMDYYDYTGDKSLVIEMAPYVHELLDSYASWRGKNGLISEAPNYMFMDWVTIGGYNCHHPPAVIGQGYLTALYYHGLDMGSRIALIEGDYERIKKYNKLRSEIAHSFNCELWVPEKKLFRDGKPFQSSIKSGRWMPADKDIETYSPHVNLLAVLYDLAPQDKQSAIVENILAEKPLNTQPWFMHWVFQSIDHAGLFNKYGTAQMRRWNIVPDTQSFREMWNSGDLSHGWCSTPLVQMSQRILGVEPTTPGFKSLVIRPQVCDLTWAKGKVPTPQGNVEVSWKLQNQKILIEVTIPKETEAEIVLPKEIQHITAGHYYFESAL